MAGKDHSKGRQLPGRDMGGWSHPQYSPRGGESESGRYNQAPEPFGQGNRMMAKHVDIGAIEYSPQ